MLSAILAAQYDPAARILNTYLFAVAAAAALPWSTSGVAIFTVLWIIALTSGLEMRGCGLRRGAR